MKITCKEYNRRWEEKNNGFVVRYFFGEYAVCDGYAPDCNALVDDTDIFAGNVFQFFKTFEEADKLRNYLNGEQI